MPKPLTPPASNREITGLWTHLIAARSERGGALEAQDIERAGAHMPHCTHTIIEDAGHDIHLDQPQAFMHQLKQFLATF